MADNQTPKNLGASSDGTARPLPPGIEAPLSIMQLHRSPSYFDELEAIPSSPDDVDWKDWPAVLRDPQSDWFSDLYPNADDC